MKVAVLGCATGLFGRLREAGIEPLALARNADEQEAFDEAGVARVEAMPDYFEAIDHPRLFFLDIELGDAIDRFIDEAYAFMEPGDIVIDPSGSYWCDTLRRYRRMRHRSLYYIDVAWLTREGTPCLIASGDKRGVELARPALNRWAGAEPCCHAGGAGLAHYMLMIEDAVANAEAQARNEAALMLEAFPSQIDENAVKALFPLTERRWMGRAAWQLDDALRLEASTPLMAQATMLSLAEAHDELLTSPPAPRVGPFQHPDEIL